MERKDLIALKISIALLFLVALSGTEGGGLPNKNCSSDNDCPKNSFCLIKPPLCSTCLNCSIYNRHDGNEDCVRDPKACGPCLKGYSNTNGGYSFTCLDDSYLSPPVAQKMDNNETSVNSRWILISGLTLMFVITVGMHIYQRRNVTNRGSSPTSTVHSPPPPYDNYVTTVDIENSSARSFSLRIQENSGNDKQTAVPFCSLAYYTQSCSSLVASEIDHIEPPLEEETINDNTVEMSNSENISEADLVAVAPNPQDATSARTTNSSTISELPNNTSATLPTADDCDSINNEQPAAKRRRIDEENNESQNLMDDNDTSLELNWSINQGIHFFQ